METRSDGFFYFLIYALAYLISVVNQSLKKFPHLFPAFPPCSIKDSWKKERDFVEDFILPADQTVDFVVHKLEVNFHELIGHFVRFVIGQEFRNDFESRYLYDFVAVFSERKQGIGEGLLFVFGELD